MEPNIDAGKGARMFIGMIMIRQVVREGKDFK